jgi:hypothetical protein
LCKALNRLCSGVSESPAQADIIQGPRTDITKREEHAKKRQLQNGGDVKPQVSSCVESVGAFDSPITIAVFVKLQDPGERDVGEGKLFAQLPCDADCSNSGEAPGLLA